MKTGNKLRIADCGLRIEHLFLLVFLLGLAGCGDKPSLAVSDAAAERKTATLRQQLEEIQGVAGAPEVPVVPLAKGPMREELSITGELAPSDSVIVKPLMDGRITFLRPIKVGDMVKKGETIAKIDDRDIEDEIEWQQKQISLSNEKIKLDEQTIEQSKKDLEFDKQLVKEGYLNQHEFEKSEMSLKQNEIALSQSQIGLEQEQNRLNKALRGREKVPIIAPIGGMVVLPSHLTSDEKSNLLNEEIMSLEGTLVGTGTPIFGIVSQEGFMAVCQANGRDKVKIQEGLPARVTVITHRPITVTGRVSKISLLQDVKTHAHKIWITMDEVDKTFTSGLFVRANIELARKEDALVVRKEWVKERNNRQFVQVVQGNSVKDHWVTTGLSEDDRIELAEGVDPGVLVIASKDVFAAEQAVRPVEVEPEADEGGRIVKITPDEGVLPIVYKRGVVKKVSPIVLMLNEETTPTRSRLRVRIGGAHDFREMAVYFNNQGPLAAPEKIVHEDNKPAAFFDLPAGAVKRGKNEAQVRYNGAIWQMQSDVSVETVELWIE